MSFLLAGCSSTGDSTPSSNDPATRTWWQWRDEKLDVDLAVSRAINEPGGGDYARAVAITRASDRPQGIKDLQVGQLILGGIAERSDRRSPATLEQGLKLIENASLQEGEASEVAPQQLRLLFERGDGAPPNNIPVTPSVAACWLAIEQRRSDDPARCIALRRRILPRVGL